MKVLIATGIFPPDIGGPATYSKMIAEELVKRGHEITVVTYSDEEFRVLNLESSKIQNSKFKIRNVSRKLPKGIRHLAYLWEVLKNGFRADIIYAQDAVSAGFPAACASLMLHKRFFLKVVGDHAWEQGVQRFGISDLLDDFLGKNYGLRIWFLRAAEKFVAKRAVRVVVPSEYLQSVVRRWGVSDKKIIVIPNAVSSSHVVISKEEARAKLGLNGFILLSVGRLVPWKGFGMLIELMPRLREKIKDVTLVIIGSGPEENKLRVTSAELRVPVIFTGSVSKDVLAQYLAAADIFCLNTGYEGFSHQLIEGMAAGIPVITTDAGGNKEIVSDGENALVARYNDKEDWEKQILRLYEDTALGMRLGVPQQDITKKYSVEYMVQKIENLFLTT